MFFLGLVQEVHILAGLASEQSLVAEPLEMLVRSSAKCRLELPHPSPHSLIRHFHSAPPSASLSEGPALLRQVEVGLDDEA